MLLIRSYIYSGNYIKTTSKNGIILLLFDERKKFEFFDIFGISMLSLKYVLKTANKHRAHLENYCWAAASTNIFITNLIQTNLKLLELLRDTPVLLNSRLKEIVYWLIISFTYALEI